MKSADKVMVIGAGTMGRGIALVAAQSGFETTLYDIADAPLEAGMAGIEAALQKAIDKGKSTQEDKDRTLANLQKSTDLSSAAGAQLVIEAIPEVMQYKTELFGKLSEIVSAEAILATNTSSLSVTEIAASASHPERVVGMHFFNPPYILKLLELVRAEQTSDAVLDQSVAFAERLGRELVVVNDSPGFATSRLGLVIGLEAMRMLEQGVGSAEDIDRAMELGYRHPMGPLRLTDLVGLDVRLAIAEHLHREIGEQFRPPHILRKMVRAGKLGKKSGQGFYSW